MNINFAWNHFYAAILGLCRQTDPLPQRVAQAYFYNLRFVNPELHLPEGPVRDRFGAIRSKLTAVGSIDDEDTIFASACALTEPDLQDLVEQIVSLFDEITREHELRYRGLNAA